METTNNQEMAEKKEQSLFFSEALKKIISDLSTRSQEIIFARYGVFNSGALTLEEIGKKYSITRERVRQVIREVLKKVKDKSQDPLFAEVQEKIVLAITKNGGIMEKGQLLKSLGKSNSSEEAAICFFLECTDAAKEIEVKGELLLSYMLPNFNVEEWRKVKDAVIETLEVQKKPLSAQEIYDLVKDDVNIEGEIFENFLEVSEQIKQNNFGKWGIAKWKEISPKGTREKSYLVLKEANEPLHFRDIAKKIDQYNLNKKKTHPQTVHNELIKDKNFVLVGRGIYALVEWGYKKGTVKDVIEEILKKSSKPLKKDDILKKVLEIRHVKKSTIVINLNNYFSKSKDGTYSLK